MRGGLETTGVEGALGKPRFNYCPNLPHLGYGFIYLVDILSSDRSVSNVKYLFVTRLYSWLRSR